ncbi:site-specific integrase [Microvirga splendida]|uniref:Site-specific integrase n=1 Tax=Microvirga splendida TaxID=2795727 RepID=A0ABS0Y7T7_9HYPH|nr:site-specific integrase [Microvirga splendida]MBJ6128372.1 site-specific integrase [Microvirga splendida]
MVLLMSRPFKHPKTGIFWLRKRVPKDLVPILGKAEVSRSLETRDPAEAKTRHLQILSELEAQWANLRAGPQTLALEDIRELSSFAHDRWLAVYRDTPEEQKSWRTDIADQMWRQPDPNQLLSADYLSRLDMDEVQVRNQEDWCRRTADEILQARGLMVDERSRTRLEKAVAAAIQRASLTLESYAEGRVDDESPLASAAAIPLRKKDVRKPIPFEELVTGWAAENKPAPKTLYEWRRIFKQLIAFLSHDDAGRLTPDDLVGWKAQMIASGLHGKTIRDAKIAPVRAVLRWAVDNRRLPSNPAERITVDVKAAAGTQKRSFSDQEAAVVLKAARSETNPVRRWVPWVCAYSGARLSEVCQLRREDIVLVDDIWCMRLVPEAGSLKTVNAERTVPLHQALIDEGFLSFVESVRAGPLFSGLRPDKFGRRGGTGTKQLGRWVRALGITDPRLQPNHSWRHRMRTLGRRHGLAPDIVDAIVGHARRSVADRYGEFEVTALSRELAKIPILSDCK